MLFPRRRTAYYGALQARDMRVAPNVKNRMQIAYPGYHNDLRVDYYWSVRSTKVKTRPLHAPLVLLPLEESHVEEEDGSKEPRLCICVGALWELTLELVCICKPLKFEDHVINCKCTHMHSQHKESHARSSGCRIRIAHPV